MVRGTRGLKNDPRRFSVGLELLALSVPRNFIPRPTNSYPPPPPGQGHCGFIAFPNLCKATIDSFLTCFKAFLYQHGITGII